MKVFKLKMSLLYTRRLNHCHATIAESEACDVYTKKLFNFHRIKKQFEIM